MARFLIKGLGFTKINAALQFGFNEAKGFRIYILDDDVKCVGCLDIPHFVVEREENFRVITPTKTILRKISGYEILWSQDTR